MCFLTTTCNRLKATVLICAVILAFSLQNFPARATTLSIAPVAQQQPEWCWLTAGQMIFTYYQIPPINTGSYQCGILQAAGLPCANFGSGALGNASAVMAQMLHTYPILVQRIYPQSAIRQINAIPLGRPAYPQEIQWMINNGLPFIAGISPSMPVAIPGVAQHAVVVVGYDVDQMGNSYVTVNDPFPYNVPLLLNGPGMPPTSVPDPYLNAYVAAEQLQPGQYRVEYNHFLHGLKWVDTIDVRPVP